MTIRGVVVQAILAAVACATFGSSAYAGETKAADAAENAGDEVGEAADKAASETNKAGRKVKRQTKKAVKATGAAIEKTGEESKAIDEGKPLPPQTKSALDSIRQFQESTFNS